MSILGRIRSWVGVGPGAVSTEAVVEAGSAVHAGATADAGAAVTAGVAVVAGVADPGALGTQRPESVGPVSANSGPGSATPATTEGSNSAVAVALRLLSPLWLRLALAILCVIVPAGSLEADTVPIRVVSQTVGTDELLLALAKPEQVAALSFQSRNPDFSAVADQAKAYPQLVLNGDAEDVLKHRPTLVLVANYSRAELVAQVRRAGVRTIVFDRYLSLQDAYENLRILGRAIGAEARVEEVIASCETRVATLTAKLKNVRRARVIAPSTYGLIPGEKTTFQDLCEHAGAENLAATLGHLVDHAPPPAEQMLTWPVDYVVLAGGTIEEALKPFRELPPYQFMPAVQKGRAVLLRPHLLSCVSQYRVDGYEELARALHPEAFR